MRETPAPSNPYQSPGERGNKNQLPSRAWGGVLWAVIGFAFGTALLSALVLSPDPRDRITGGMIYGGTPLGLIGLAYGLRRPPQS